MDNLSAGNLLDGIRTAHHTRNVCTGNLMYMFRQNRSHFCCFMIDSVAFLWYYKN